MSLAQEWAKDGICVNALAPGVFPESFRGHGGAVGRYFESAAVIVTLVLLGQVDEGDIIRAVDSHQFCDCSVGLLLPASETHKLL